MNPIYKKPLVVTIVVTICFCVGLNSRFAVEPEYNNYIKFLSLYLQS